MEKFHSKTIVFITGAFVSHFGWKNWIKYFEDAGYVCYNPPWPFKDDLPANLRDKHPHRKLAELRLAGLLGYYRDFINSLPEKPILIGHSTGGLLVQLLLQQKLGAAGIAIHSVPPQGVLCLKISFLKSLWAPLGLFKSANKTYLMSFQQWQYAFTNGMSLGEQENAYRENVVPESRRVLRDCLSKVAKVDFKMPHPPLLFISGTSDQIMPASLNYSNFKKYEQTGSITMYKEFVGKNHFVLGLPTWEDEAGYCLKWIETYRSYGKS